jgi:uncharacterized membrane protein
VWEDFKAIGWSRFFQLYFAWMLFQTVHNLLTNQITDFSYHWIGYTFDSIFLAFSLYLIHERSRLTRYIIPAGCLAVIFMALMVLSIQEEYKLPNILTTLQIHFPFLIVVGAYFLFSKKVKLIYNQPFETRENPTIVLNHTNFRVDDLMMQFMFFSIIGQIMEDIYGEIEQIVAYGQPNLAWLLEKGLTPAFPYGFGYILCIILVVPLSHWLCQKVKRKTQLISLLFVINMVLMSSVEFICGIIGNRNYQNWDYRTRPFNIMGQVCLQNAIGFGIVATFVVLGIYPIVQKVLQGLTATQYRLLMVLEMIIYLTLFIYYLL